MSYATLSAALISAVEAAIPSVKVVHDAKESDLAALAQQPTGIVANIVLEQITYEPGAEFGAMSQAQTWMWRIELLVPAKTGGTEVVHDLATSLLAALTPAAGLRLSTQSDFLNAALFENAGELGASRLATLTLTHRQYPS